MSLPTSKARDCISSFEQPITKDDEDKSTTLRKKIKNYNTECPPEDVAPLKRVRYRNSANDGDIDECLLRWCHQEPHVIFEKGFEAWTLEVADDEHDEKNVACFDEKDEKKLRGLRRAQKGYDFSRMNMRSLQAEILHFERFIQSDIRDNLKDKGEKLKIRVQHLKIEVDLRGLQEKKDKFEAEAKERAKKAEEKAEAEALYHNIDDHVHEAGPAGCLNLDKRKHIFVGTTKRRNWYLKPDVKNGQTKVYRYEIHAPGGIDVEESLGERYKYKSQKGICFVKGIHRRYIRSAALWAYPEENDTGESSDTSESSDTGESSDTRKSKRKRRSRKPKKGQQIYFNTRFRPLVNKPNFEPSKPMRLQPGEEEVWI